MAMYLAGVRVRTADWETVEHLIKPRRRSRAALARVVRPWHSLPDYTTPAPSLTTVMCPAGDWGRTGNWGTEEHLTKPRPRSPAASVWVGRPWRSLPEVPTPAPSLTTVMCPAGEMERTANWATVAHLTKPHPQSRAAWVRVARPWGSLPENITPAPSSTTVPCRAGAEGQMANWVTEGRPTKPRPN